MRYPAPRHLTYIALASALLLTLFAFVSTTQARPAGAGDKTVRLSPAGESYIDPEILPGGSLMAYQSQDGIYLAALDPQTGLFVSPTGNDTLVDTGAARPLETLNGPEFGINANGWALYYAKPSQGTVQVWQAIPDASGTPRPAPLTTGARHQTQLASRNPNAPTTHIAAIQGTWDSGTAVWFDAANPAQIHEIVPVEKGVLPLRWVNDSFLLTFRHTSGPERGQIALLDTATNTSKTITADAGDKTDPYGWYAPDFGGDLLVLAVVDNAAIAVYRDTGGAHWERIATLAPPSASRYTFVASAEPFVVNGKSYISLVIKDAASNHERFTDSEVWLFDINDAPDARYAERCDDGAVGMARSDPEVFIAAEHVYVYYNVIQGKGITAPYEIHRCQSQIAVSGPSTLVPFAAPVRADDANCQWVNPKDTDPRIDIALEPHYVCHDPSATSRSRLLVFFPGTNAIPEQYQLFVQEAAAMGLHAIGLTYPNEDTINLALCPRDPDPDCHEHIRRETLIGQDLHPKVTVNEANSIYNRTVKVLQSLNKEQPNAGWDYYLEGETIRWDRLVVAGHSQGGGTAAFVAHNYAVARAIIFSWVDLVRGQLAPWVSQPHATPAERIFTFEHVDDRKQGEAARLQMFEAFGIKALGEASIDSAAPPYGTAHVLLTSITPTQRGPNEFAGAHNVVVVDDYTPVKDGVPALRDVWRYLLDVHD